MEDKNMNKATEPTGKARSSESAFNNLVIRPVRWLWGGLSAPLAFFLMFWVAGVGFYQGVVDGDNVAKLLHGKALIITMVDLKGGDDD